MQDDKAEEDAATPDDTADEPIHEPPPRSLIEAAHAHLDDLRRALAALRRRLTS